MMYRGWTVLSVVGVTLAAVWIAPYACARSGAIPSLADVRAEWEPSDAQVLDRDGHVLHELRVDERRRRLAWTPLEAVSPALRAAVVASEDRRLWRHNGVDMIAVLGVILRALPGQSPRGASTITMQLATILDSRLRRSGGSRTMRQKWQQMRWAWAIEQHWTKAAILEAYLNLITFRGELQGVAAASRVLLDKTPDGITDGEALALAALIRAPNADSETVRRRAQRLRDATGVPVVDDDIAAVAQRLTHRGSVAAARRSLAPHLARRLLPTASTIRDVQSTVDSAVQETAQHALRRQLLTLRDNHVRDGAVLVVDNASGDVLAYVGGSDELSSGRYVDAIRAHRQAGSTLKPFLYALTLDRRLLTPASLIDDRPLEIPVFGGLYRPENYDQQFHGPVTVRTALAGSLNIPAVRTLHLVGADAFVDHLRHLGFTALHESGEYYGPALALGAADVSLEELVNAYRALANGGVFRPLRMRSTDADAPHVRAYSDAAAFVTSSILADRESRSVTFGLESPLATRFWSAVKTGTSKSMRDNWCIGYSQRFTVGVWVGNLSGRPMRGVSGMSGAAPIWLEVMERLHRAGDGQPPSPPVGVIAVRLAMEGPEPGHREWFVAGTEPATDAVQPASRRARITAPAAGTVIALDPDIPPAHQRVALRAEGSEDATRWVLDGLDLELSPPRNAGDREGAIAATTLWAPQCGPHRLSLVARDDAVLDTVKFTVRGCTR